MAKVKYLYALVVGAALLGVTSVQAALPASFTTEITLIKDDVVDVMTQSISILGLCILAGLPIFGLIYFLRKGKKGFRAAS